MERTNPACKCGGGPPGHFTTSLASQSSRQSPRGGREWDRGRDAKGTARVTKVRLPTVTRRMASRHALVLANDGELGQSPFGSTIQLLEPLRQASHRGPRARWSANKCMLASGVTGNVYRFP
jgi:hypothetical protein